MIIKHSVNDQAAWRSVYDGATDLRAKYGLTDDLRDPSDGTTLLILKEAMQKAGVTTQPRVEFFQQTG